jgi:hypothetical protein
MKERKNSNTITPFNTATRNILTLRKTENKTPVYKNLS